MRIGGKDIDGSPAAARWAAALGALVYLALPWLLEHLANPPPALRATTASFGETVHSARMRERTLPHRWLSECSDCRTVWYRFEFALPDPPREAWVLYLPVIGQNAAVYLNGRLLGQGGPFADPAARLGSQPLLVSAPSALWLPGANQIYVLVKSDRPRFGLMPAPAIGAESALQGSSRLRHALAVTLPQVLATAATMLALLMGVLAWYRRAEPDYAALAAVAVAFGVQSFSAQVIEPPVASAMWDGWMALCAAVVALAVFILALSLTGVGRAPRRTSIGLLAALALPAAALAAWLEPTGLGADAAQSLTQIALALAGAWLAAVGARRGDARLLWPGLVLVAAALADLARPAWNPEALPMLPWAMAALLGAAGWLLLVRFVETLNAAELLNIDLESLVRSRTAESQAQFERVRELERREAIAAERERLMRDMHDGVGGHLVSMLAMIEADRRRPGELATVVRDALDDMRLMIDSLDPVDDDLNAVLAMFHDRLAPRLRASNVELHWNVELLPAVPGLTPARVLHVLRMLQEAVTNALRHGRARRLWIDAAATSDGVRIAVRDDGCGFDPRSVAGGRGLRNQQRRAAAIGAALEIDSSVDQGTTVRIVIPAALA